MHNVQQGCALILVMLIWLCEFERYICLYLATCVLVEPRKFCIKLAYTLPLLASTPGFLFRASRAWGRGYASAKK